MRILYLVNLYPSLSHTFIRREIQALEELGHDVIRVSVRPPDRPLIESSDVEEARKTTVLLRHGAFGLLPDLFLTLLRKPIRCVSASLHAFGLSRSSETGSMRHLAYFAEACALARIATRTGTQHIHAHFGTNPPIVALLAERLGAPGFSFTVHGPEEFDRARSLRLAQKMAAARFTVAISSFGRAQLKRFGAQVDHDRIHVVHCGLPASMLERVPVAQAGSSDLLFVGRLSAQKDPLLLADAAALLVAEGVDFCIRVVGTGELDQALATRIQDAGLARHFVLLGALDGVGVLRELENCRALVLPSSAEGLPVVLMEALALQRPVITTFVAGIPELVRTGREGWLFPAGDVRGLADAMKAALRATTAELQSMGVAGAERVRRRHDVHESARRLAALFQRYCQPSPE